MSNKTFKAQIHWNDGDVQIIEQDGWNYPSEFENWLNYYVGSSGRWELI